MTYLARQDTYRAVPFALIVRHPGAFGVTITLVSGPSLVTVAGR